MCAQKRKVDKLTSEKERAWERKKKKLTKHWHAVYQPPALWGNHGKVTLKAGMASFPSSSFFSSSLPSLCGKTEVEDQLGHRKHTNTQRIQKKELLFLCGSVPYPNPYQKKGKIRKKIEWIQVSNGWREEGGGRKKKKNKG